MLELMLPRQTVATLADRQAADCVTVARTSALWPWLTLLASADDHEQLPMGTSVVAHLA